MQSISAIIRQSIAVKEALLADSALHKTLTTVIEVICTAYRADHKVLFCGNGGSAADAQHLAAELSGKFYLDRPPLFAEALHVNSSYLTAVANDYDFAETYRRMVLAQGRPGDVLICLSTSGNSANVVEAARTAREKGLITVGFTGAGGGQLATICTHLLPVPSRDVPRIQESHILLGHIVCESVENELFSGK